MADENRIADLHERINLRGMLEKFLDISVFRFQESLDKRKILGNDILYNSFKKALFYNGGNMTTAQLTYLAYGRMVDMGVGKGVTWARQHYYRGKAKERKKDGITRRPKRWIGKVKRRELHRLREILTEQYQIGLLAEVRKEMTEILTENTQWIKENGLPLTW